MSTLREQASAVGGRTLEALANTRRFNEWIYSKLAPGVRGDVLEVGSGIGNISAHILRDAKRLTVTDAEPHYLQGLSKTFAGDGRVDVASYDLDGPPPPELAARQFDSIVAVNVVEHIADDVGLVKHLATLLRPGGHLLVYVPACPFAFGTLDTALGHYRRYTRATLRACVQAGGLDPGTPHYMNLVGLAAWLVYGRLLRRTVLDTHASALFEWLLPLVRLEDHIALPVGLSLYTHATKRA